MKTYYDTPSGALDGEALRSFQIVTDRKASARPFGMYTPMSKLIVAGKRMLAGDIYVRIAEDLGITRRTLTRFRHKIGLPEPPSRGWPKGKKKAGHGASGGRLLG